MRVATALFCGLLLAGCDGTAGQTLPDGVSAADVALFRAAVTDAGCEINDDADAAPVEARTGFSDDKLRIITQYLRLNGETDVTASGFRLTSGSCANA